MADSMILCPKCGEKIPLNSAIEGPIAERLRAEYEAAGRAKEQGLAEREKMLLSQKAALEKARAAQELELETKLAGERAKLVAQAKVNAEAQLAAQLGELRTQLGEKAKLLETAQGTELELRKQRRELEQQKESLKLEVSRRVDEECAKITVQVKEQTQKGMEEEYRRKEAERGQEMERLRVEVAVGQRRAESLATKEKELAGQMFLMEEARRGLEEQVAQKMAAERAKLTADAMARAKESQAGELKDLEGRLKEKEEKLAAAQAMELDLRKKQRELDEQKRELELKAARTIDEERAKIREDALKGAAEANRLKEKEAELQLASMRQQINELKQKAEQGSQQLQGEVLELELEGMLRAAFPHDQILPVAKGVHGGDVVHKVMTVGLQHCGTILWESKRTKTWSDGWIDKLKMDQRAAKADVAVIVSIAMPRDLKHIGCVEGVWIASRECMMGMVLALRDGLLRMAHAKRAEEGKHEKMEVLYAYFSGHEFKQRVEAIKEAFVTMREELEAEKRAITKIWAKREMQLNRVAASTAGMQGDLSGIIGAAMPEVEGFELKALAQGDD